MGACCTRSEQNEDLNFIPTKDQMSINKARANLAIPTEDSSNACRVMLNI